MTNATTDESPAPGTDPEAPYGYKTDGTPKKAPGGRPPGSGPKPRGKIRAPRRNSRPRTPRPPGPTDYRPGLHGVVGLGSMVLARLGAKTPPTEQSTAFALDAATLALHGDGLVDAVVMTADQVAFVRLACEKLNAVGPFGPLIGKLTEIGAQVAVNHGVIPPEVGAKFGAIPPDQLLGDLGARVAAEYSAPPEPAPEPEPAPAPFERREPPAPGQGFEDVPMPFPQPVG